MLSKLPADIQSVLFRDAEKRDPVTARRANLIRVLLRQRYLTREALIERVEFKMGYPSFGKKSWEDNFYRDMRVVKKALRRTGYELQYSRKKERSGYYFANEPALGEKVKREIAGAVRELDDAQIEIYKKMSPAQKFYQSASIIDLGRQVQKRQHIHE